MDMKNITRFIRISSVCRTCLSRNRSSCFVYKFNDMKILFPDIKFEKCDRICWECKAMAKKWLAFKERTYRAQRLLLKVTRDEELQTLESLSRLKPVEPITSSYDGLVIEVPILPKIDPLDNSVSEAEEADTGVLTGIFHNDGSYNEEYEIKEETIVPALDLNEDEECWKAEDEIKPKTWKVERVPTAKAVDNISTNKTASQQITKCFQDFIKHEIFNEGESKIKSEIVWDSDNIGSNICDVNTYENNVTNVGIKIIDKQKEINESELNLNSKERMFIIRKMTEEEMYNTRELDRNLPRYISYTYKCDSCIVGYYNKEKYMKHFDEKHSEKAGPYICPICKVHFWSKKTSSYHHECHFRSYKCKLCDYTRHKISTIMIHITKEHERGRKYDCKMCGMIFDSPRSLRYHRDTNHRELPKCDVCNKTFSTNASLKEHMFTHVRTSGSAASIPRLACPTCDKACVGARALRSHVMRVHAPPSERAYCAHCDKQFKYVQLYRRHLNTHARHVGEGALKFQCAHCDAKFSTKSTLNGHISCKHMKRYPYSCDVCRKVFSARHRLKAHVLMSHEGVKRPKDKICTYCGKGFSTRHILTNHIRTHTGERPFQCDQCASSFTQKSALKTHVKALHLKNKTVDK